MPLKSAMPYVDDVLHGVSVRDPYRWLEDRNSQCTEEWIRAQQKRYEAYFAAYSDLKKVEERVRNFLEVEVVDQPVRVGGFCFYRKRQKGQEQGSIYVRKEAGAEERLLVDPVRYGRLSSVGIHRISADGRFLAFEVKQGGGDRKLIQIMDVEYDSILPDTIPLGYARGFVFLPDREGYLYVQEAKGSSEDHCIRLHHFGDSGEDEIIFRARRVAGSRLVLIASSKRLGAYWLRQQGSDWIADFSVATFERMHVWTQVLAGQLTPCSPMFWHDKILALVEDKSRNKCLVELFEDGRESTVFIPDILSEVRQLAITDNHIFVSYLDDGVSAVDSWHITGKRCTSIDLPANGTVDILPFSTEASASFFYTYESFDTPLSIYEYDCQTGQVSPWFQSAPANRSLPATVRRESITAKDGVRVPLTIVSVNGSAYPPAAPVIMTSYGGFGVTLTPRFSVLVAVLMELGAVLVIAHIRGGGEFGKAWHDAGRARNKQVAIDDFLSTAEWLCLKGVATPKQFAIFGGSNAGLLVAAAMTQRPDLFSAVLCIAPLVDMIRYEVLDHGEKWRLEYGTVDDAEDFQALYAYSPYHHVRVDSDYPATMSVTGDQDERCNPAHTRKMAALLQDRAAQSSTVIVDYSDERGHAPTMPLSIRIVALTRRIAFLCRELGLSWPSGDDYGNRHF